MRSARSLLCGTLAVTLLSLATAPAQATTLVRQSLDRLVRSNSTIVVGEVAATRSYWNDQKSLILTDVRLVLRDTLKGRLQDKEIVVTLLGGKLADHTALILGGAELIPGKSYVLFLNEDDFPGAKGVRTVRDHCQGAFEVVLAEDGLRAVSQASRHPLFPDEKGLTEAVGGSRGIPLESFRKSIRAIISERQGFLGEVK